MRLVIPQRGRALQNVLLDPRRDPGSAAGETGACGLPARNSPLDLAAINIKQKVWHGKIETVKSWKRQLSLRNFSAARSALLRGILRTRRPNRLGLLFAIGHGMLWDMDVVRKRGGQPWLQTLKIERCGFHAFRHGN